MKKLVCLSILLSSFLFGCASSEKSENMLEKRSAYFLKMQELSPELLKKRSRSRQRVYHIYAWRHEEKLPAGDTFLGGWLELEIK